MVNIGQLNQVIKQDSRFRRKRKKMKKKKKVLSAFFPEDIKNPHISPKIFSITFQDDKQPVWTFFLKLQMLEYSGRASGVL